MSNIDVSMKLRLERSGFRETERDLKDIQRAASAFGSQGTKRVLAGELAATSKQAGELKQSLASASLKADQIDRQGLNRFRREVGATSSDAHRLSTAFTGANAKVEQLDRVRLDRMRRQFGGAATDVDRLSGKLDRLGTMTPKARELGDAAHFMAGGMRSAVAAFGAFAAPGALLAGLDRLADKFREIDRLATKVAVTAEDRNPATQKAILEANKALGRKIGGTQTEIADARQVYMAGNIPLADQEKVLAPTLRTAIGAQASPTTIATAGRAFLQTMRGRPEEIPAAYDIMAKGANLGSFELEALAGNLPKLGSQAQPLGMTGLKGLSEVVAMAEIVAKASGSDDEAANNLSNFFGKINSPETIENFKKKRSNLPRLMKDAKAQGRSVPIAVLDEIQRLTQGDPQKLGQLFQDAETLSAIRPLLDNRKLLDEWQGKIANESKGLSDKNYGQVVQSPAGREDLEKARREAANVTIGGNVEPGAAFTSRAFTRASEDAARLSGKGILGAGWEIYKSINPFVGGDFGLAGRYLREPDDGSEEADERVTEAQRLQREIEREQASIAKSGRSQHWGADSRIATRQRRINEIRAELKGEIASAEGSRRPDGEMPTLDSEALEKRIENLTNAVRKLDETLTGSAKGGVDPIAFRSFQSFSGGGRIINASLGSSGSEAYRGAYSSGAPVMDGFAGSSGGGTPRGAAPFMSGGPTGNIEATTNPGGAAGELFDVFRATGNNDAQSLALLGHAKQESELNPKAWNAGEGAGGILQWRGNRLANLKTFAASKGMDWQDRSVQAAYVRHEMENDPYERKRSERFRSATTIEEASAGLADYVRFGDNSAGTRLQNARDYAGQFGVNGLAAAQGGGPRAPVTYSNSGATRNRPVTSDLLANIQRGVAAVYGEGYRAEIYSGGQAAKGMLGRRTGSTRHDDHGRGGEAADLYVYGPDGKRVTGDELARLGQHWAATNQGGVGMEMRGGGIHLDGHKDRARSWNYARQGGRYTRGQAEAMKLGLAGVPPVYANPGALDPNAVAEAKEQLGSAPEGGFHDDGWSKKTKASRPVPSWAEVNRATPRPGAGAGPGRAPSSPSRATPSVTIHQNFTGTDPGLQARRAQREQGRAIKMAEARAMHDTTVPIS